jgi:aminopeptidase N
LTEKPVHPIASNESNFDGITYDTGCSVLRMIEGITGQNEMYKIVKTYLKTYEYSNADMNDLLNIIDQVITFVRFYILIK